MRLAIYKDELKDWYSEAQTLLAEFKNEDDKRWMDSYQAIASVTDKARKALGFHTQPDLYDLPKGWDTETWRQAKDELDNELGNTLLEDTYEAAEVWIEQSEMLFLLDAPLETYRPTPNLREKVMACMDEVAGDGWNIRRGTYVSGADAAQRDCCALGAVSVCEADGSTRDRGECFALTAKHLGCNPLEIDSIEAGFEGWSFYRMVWAEEIKDEELCFYAAFDDEAYKIGQDVYDKYVLNKDGDR